MKRNNNKLIVVLGMHRSGTSAITRSLQVLGIELGKYLYPPAEDNPTGFWEDRNCIAINEELLGHLGSEYDRLDLAWNLNIDDPTISRLYSTAIQLVSERVSQSNGLWGVKDPRMCRLLGFWKKVFDTCNCDVSYVISLRDPISVAESLENRNRISPEKSCFLWLQHMVPAIMDSRAATRVVVNYDSLVDEPEKQIARIASHLRIPFDAKNNALMRDFSENYLQNSLRHSQYSLEQISSDRRLPYDALKAYELLLRVARDEISIDSDEVQDNFEQFQFNLQAYAPIFAYANLLELEIDRLRLHAVQNDGESPNPNLVQPSTMGKVQLAITLAERNQQIASLSTQLVEKEQELVKKEQQIIEKEKELIEKKRYAQAQLAEKEQSIRALSVQLAEIAGSKTWKLGSLFRRFYVLIAPPNSQRAWALRQLMNLIVVPFMKISRNRNLDEDLALLKSSSLFDETWYLNNYPDIALAKIDSAQHYLLFGAFEGRDPGPDFSSTWYLTTYKDVKKAKVNPLVHYLQYGMEEKREIHPTLMMQSGSQGQEPTNYPLQGDGAETNSGPIKYIPISDENFLAEDGKLKIVLVVHQFVPEYSSGTEILTYETAKALQNLGHNVIVFTGYPASGKLKDYERFDRYMHNGIRVERFRHSYIPMGNQSNVMEIEYNNELLGSYFREFLKEEKPDIVHFFHLSRLSASPIDICSELDIPTVLTPTDFWFICHTSHLKWPNNQPCPGPDKFGVNCLRHMIEIHRFTRINTLFQFLPDWLIAALILLIKHGVNIDSKYSPYVLALVNRRGFLRKRMNLVNQVVVPSQVMMSSLTKNGLEIQRTISIPFGLNLSYLQNAKRPPHSNILRLGYIGTLYEHKGVHTLVEAIKKLEGRPVELLIYGKLDEFPDYVESLKSIIQDDPRVKFCGPFPNPEIGKIFSGLDVLVVPSLWHENTPLVIYSAQAAKCPVIASDMAGMSEVIEHGKNGLLFERGSVEDLVTNIEILLDDRALLQKLSDNAKKPLSMQEYATKLLEIYSHLVQKEKTT